MHRTRKIVKLGSLLLILTVLLMLRAHGQSSRDALESVFVDPPDSAKPRVWWHWMNGNITKEGIKLDLEWMKRVGIGGFQNFDAALNTPKLVDKRLVYMTPEWKDAFKYATALADQLGLEEAIAGSPGWSESGGPWVKPNQGMKKIVWSETRIEGGKPSSVVLPHPPTTTGPFQNVPVFNFLASITGRPQAIAPTFYADTAVIAYRAPESDVLVTALQPKITSAIGVECNPISTSKSQNVSSPPVAASIASQRKGPSPSLPALINFQPPAFRAPMPFTKTTVSI